MDDKDDWTPTYPYYLTEDYARLIRNGWVTLTLMDAIECDKRYPGLVSDIFLWLWQHNLIEQQLKDEAGGQES